MNNYTYTNENDYNTKYKNKDLFRLNLNKKNYSSNYLTSKLLRHFFIFIHISKYY